MGEGRYVACAATPDVIEREVAQLWQHAGMSDARIASKVRARLQWLYGTGNPYGPTRTWIVRDTQEARVIGSASVCPRDLLLEGETLHAGVLVDFVVLPDHRTAGPAVTLQRAVARDALSGPFSLIYGFPNHRALSVFQRVGHRALVKTVTWSRPLRAGQLLRRRLQARLAGRPLGAHLTDLLGGALSPVVDWTLRGVTAGAALFGALGAETSTLPRLEVGSAGCPGAAARDRLVPRRDPAYLGWRYSDHATEHYDFVTVHQRGRGLQGYLVYRSQAHHAFVHDLVLCGTALEKSAALARMLLELSRAGLHSVSVTSAGTTGLERLLRRALFVPRVDERALVASWTPGLARHAELLMSPNGWGLFEGDLDL